MWMKPQKHPVTNPCSFVMATPWLKLLQQLNCQDPALMGNDNGAIWESFLSRKRTNRAIKRTLRKCMIWLLFQAQLIMTPTRWKSLSRSCGLVLWAGSGWGCTGGATSDTSQRASSSKSWKNHSHVQQTPGTINRHQRKANIGKMWHTLHPSSARQEAQTHLGTAAQQCPQGRGQHLHIYSIFTAYLQLLN